MEPSCTPGLATYTNIDHIYFDMAFPCGYDLTKGAELLEVIIKAVDETPCMDKTMIMTEFGSMLCNSSCGTKDLNVIVKFKTRDGVVNENTFEHKYVEKERLGTCVSADSDDNDNGESSATSSMQETAMIIIVAIHFL